MNRLVATVAFLLAFFLVSFFAGGRAETSIHCSGNNCLVSASASMLSAALGVVFFVTLLLLPRRSVSATDRPVGFGRTLGAVFIDMIITLRGFAALFAMPMLIAEYMYTGSFEWTFVRGFTRPTDWVFTLSSVSFLFAVIFLMRVASLKSGNPSFGQYLLGYIVVSDRGNISAPLAVKRLAWATLYFLVWPLYLIYKKVKKLERDLWDARCNTKSVRFQYS